MVVHPEQTTRESLPRRFSDVTIRLADGRTLHRRVAQAKGQPGSPLSDAALDAKFRDAAGVVLPAERVAALLARLKTIETVADVAEVARLTSS